MKKTKIAFEDIKAGDLLEVVAVINGIKYTGTGIAFEKSKTKQGDSEWQTSEGGTLTIEDDEDAIYRIDVTEVKFEDIKRGDRIKLTAVRGTVERTITGVAWNFKLTDAAWYDSWETKEGDLLLRRGMEKDNKIEILERGE